MEIITKVEYRKDFKNQFKAYSSALLVISPIIYTETVDYGKKIKIYNSLSLRYMKTKL